LIGTTPCDPQADRRRPAARWRGQAAFLIEALAQDRPDDLRGANEAAMARRNL
jgi:hypothetical protein